MILGGAAHNGRGAEAACENFIKKKQKILLAKLLPARHNDAVRYLRIVDGVDGC